MTQGNGFDEAFSMIWGASRDFLDRVMKLGSGAQTESDSEWYKSCAPRRLLPGSRVEDQEVNTIGRGEQMNGIILPGHPLFGKCSEWPKSPHADRFKKWESFEVEDKPYQPDVAESDWVREATALKGKWKVPCLSSSCRNPR